MGGRYLLAVDTFANKPTIVGRRVTLRPMVASDADDVWADLHDAEGIRMTGTHATFGRDQIDSWCATRAEQAHRLDLAVIDRESGVWAGEVVVNDWDGDNRSCGFRISLGPTVSTTSATDSSVTGRSLSGLTIVRRMSATEALSFSWPRTSTSIFRSRKL